jgi:hypothetical protein
MVNLNHQLNQGVMGQLIPSEWIQIFNDPAAEDHKSLVQQTVLKGHRVYVRK